MSDTGRMMVSVLMPMRNAEAYVAAALRSVLAQQSVQLEIIVIDDGSVDGSAEIVRQIALEDPRVRMLRGPCRGIAAAFNVGLADAGGEVIARCDADDLYPPGRLARQVEWLRKSPDFGAVCGGFGTISRRGLPIADMDTGRGAQEITHELRAGTARTSFCTFAVRADVMHKLGGCRDFFLTGEDIDLQLRIGECCRVWYEPTGCYQYRLHDSSITHSQGKPLQLFFEASARRFQQQRLSGRLDDLQLNLVPPLPAAADARPAPSSMQIQGLLLWTAWEQHGSGQKLRSIMTGLRAGLSHPRKLPVWKSVAALVLKPAGAGRKEAATSGASGQ